MTDGAWWALAGVAVSGSVFGFGLGLALGIAAPVTGAVLAVLGFVGLLVWSRAVSGSV